MTKQLSFAEQYALRIICAIALLFVGLAHVPLDADRYSIPLSAIAAYTLPDGTVPVLCLPSNDGEQNHHDSGSSCETCRLAASVLLPAPADTYGLPIMRQLEAFFPTRLRASYRPRIISSTSPRGPPSSVIA
jgi:hypothetical protein